MKLFIFFLFIGILHAAVVDKRKSINDAVQGKYLPPIKNFECGTKTIQVEKTVTSTTFLPRTLFTSDTTCITTTDYSTETISSTLISSVIKTLVIPSFKYETRVLTKTEEIILTESVILPQDTKYIASTSTAFVTETSTSFVFSPITKTTGVTITSTVTSTDTISKVIEKTVTEFESLFQINSSFCKIK